MLIQGTQTKPFTKRQSRIGWKMHRAYVVTGNIHESGIILLQTGDTVIVKIRHSQGQLIRQIRTKLKLNICEFSYNSWKQIRFRSRLRHKISLAVVLAANRLTRTNSNTQKAKQRC